jgi:hypothetical protein
VTRPEASDFLDCLKREFGPPLKKCAESGQGYKLKLGKIRSYMFLDGDKMLVDKKSCDCIFFAVENKCIFVAVIELKARPKNVNDVIEKLRNMSSIVQVVLEACNKEGFRVEIFPIVYHDGIHDTQKRELKKNRIAFSSKKLRIIIKEYKTPLSDIIKAFKAG